MKKLFPILLVISALFFTSCIDYVQSISYKDGEYQLYYKITLSKLLLAMGDQDPEEIFADLNDEALDSLPETVKVNAVDTDLEVGAEFSISINPRTTDEDEKALLPKTTKSKCYIPFLLGQDENSLANNMGSSDQEAQNITQAILSSAKCRILISKKIIPAIKEAYFEGYYGRDYSVPVFDYGESYCLEIPFILLFESSNYDFSRVVILKDSE